jgi:hypothetical protein
MAALPPHNAVSLWLTVKVNLLIAEAMPQLEAKPPGVFEISRR